MERDEEGNKLTMPDANYSGPGTSTTSTENESSLPNSSLMLEDTISTIPVTAATKRY